MNLHRLATFFVSLSLAAALSGCQLVGGQTLDMSALAPPATSAAESDVEAPLADGESDDGESADGESADGESADGEATDGEATDSASAAVEEMPTPEPVVVPLLPMSDLPETSASEVFDTLSPYVAFVETPSGTGSAILLESGYLVSNAHVVWPYNSVRIVFADGTEHLDVPVVAWDMVADLAMIGPLDTPASPINFVDGSNLRIGSVVYLLGYPGEVEDFPQPTITNGILSRIRVWEQIDLSYFQVDAAVTGGNSGGVMVTQQGEVVGITTFYFSGAGYGLVASAADTTSRLESILNNGDELTLSERRLLDAEPITEATITLTETWDSQIYLISETVDTEILITLEGVGNPQIYVQDIAGWGADLSVDEEDNIVEATITIEEERPYLVIISQESENKNTIHISSTHSLIPYEDPDDGIKLTVGEERLASIDYPDDEDIYEIEMKADELIEINVSSLKIDPSITILYRSFSLEEIVYDDDSGEGIFGEDAKLVYRAPEDDTYEIVVGNSYGSDVGGYFLSVSSPPTDTEPTEPQISNTFVGSPHGKLQLYESDSQGFQMLYPAHWQNSYGACGGNSTACFSDGNTGVLAISEEDIESLEKDERTLEGFTDLFIDIMEMSISSFEIESRDVFTTAQGLQASHIVLSLQGGRFIINQFLYVNTEEEVAFSAAYAGRENALVLLEPMIDYSFNTFREWDGEPPEDDPVALFDEATRLGASKAYTDALDLVNQVVEAKPDWVDAYRLRGSLHNSLDDTVQAVDDFNTAISLEPDKKHLYLILGGLYWTEEMFEEAKQTFDQAIELDAEFKEIYNMRALVNTKLADYEGALADIAAIAALEEEEEDLSPHYLDTRAYIYLKMEAYEESMADYEEALNQDFRSPYVLLGHGLVDIALGNVEAGEEMLREGMAKVEEIYEENDSYDPEPQMADLLAMAEEALAALEASE